MRQAPLAASASGIRAFAFATRRRPVGDRRSATACGLLHGRPDRRRRGVPGDRGCDRGRTRLHPRDRLAPRSSLRPGPRRPAGNAGADARGGGRTARRAGPRLGGRAGARLSSHPQPGSRHRRDAHAPDADPLRDRPARASVPLPPREDGGGRRQGRIRRRHRHHRLRRRPFRHQRPPRQASSRLARRRLAPARSGGARCPRSLRDAMARGHRRASDAAGSSARRRSPHGPDRSHGLRGDVRRSAQGRVPHPRELRARASAGQALHLSRKPVPVVAGDRPASSPTSSAIRPATTSGW